MSRLERIADKIWEEELSYSDIPERLFPKVRIQVPVKTYFKDGVFDQAAFRRAVEAEIRIWGRFLEPEIAGFGCLADRDTSGRLVKGPKTLEKEDDEWVSGMLKLGGQAD